MSIYATLWHLRFPRTGDDFVGCDWVDVYAQGVPAHVGTPTPGHGNEAGDPFAEFLPPAVAMDGEGDEDGLRAVVFVTADTTKGTERAGQEYVNPLLVVSGAQYSRLSFGGLHERLCAALRGSEPRVVAQVFVPGQPPKIYRER
jgi:hypothetical protein